MRVAVVPGTREHARAIVPIMRRVSLEQVERVGIDAKHTVEQALERTALSWAGMIDGKLVCLGGVERTTILSDSGYLWLITTKEVEAHPFIFVRRSQMMLEALFEEFRMIYGVVDRDFTRSIKWLEWLGFEIGPANEKFRAFSKSKT